MPTDSAGKRFKTHSAARAAMPAKPSKPAMGEKSLEPKGEKEGSGEAHTITANGDGSYHSDGPSGPMDHPSIGHAVTHAAHALHGGGSHMHLHHSGGGIASHHMSDSGEHEETEHSSADEAGQDVASKMEGDSQAEPEEMAANPMKEQNIFGM